MGKIRILWKRGPVCLLLAAVLCAALAPAAPASGEPSADTPIPTAALRTAETAPGSDEMLLEPDTDREPNDEPEPGEALPVPAFDGASNEETVYRFLTETMGFNAAAACGIMANIWCESGFDPNVSGDGSSSFGICQWHDWGTDEGRYTNLKNFCSDNGYDYHTLEGQLYFLRYELDTSWYGLRYIRDKMYTFPDTPQGAYDAGYYWCREFGRPADSGENPRRGVLARDTFYPKYSGYTAVECVVSFDACGGTAAGSVTVSSGGTLTVLPASVRTGYTFGGWYSQKNGEGTRLTTDTVIAADTTWYARWDANRYTVAFDTQVPGTAANTSLVSYGEAYGTLPMPGRSGYRFDGWYTDPDGGSPVTSSTVVTVAANHTLYAHWTAVQTFTVRYDANGGNGTPLPQKKLIGTGMTVTATTPRRTGYAFTGWAKDPDARGADYLPGDLYTDDSDVVLYAVWSRVYGNSAPEAAAALGDRAYGAASGILRALVGK